MDILNAFSISGKNLIITGGSRGLGKAIADDCIDKNANITVLSSNKCDLSKKEQIKDFCETYLDKHGFCDILINNAGVCNSGLAEETDIESFENMMDINLLAPFLMIKYLLPKMKERKSGVILNIASTLATRAAPFNSAYCSSKAALVQFTKCLAIEVGPFNIRVNCISPGYCKTDMNRDFFDTNAGQAWTDSHVPLKRLLKPEELLPLVQLVISDAGSYITGANLIIDGGVGLW